MDLWKTELNNIAASPSFRRRIQSLWHNPPSSRNTPETRPFLKMNQQRQMSFGETFPESISKVFIASSDQ
jgi:hypothetical protein